MMRVWPPATTSMLSRQAIVVVVVFLVLFFVGGGSSRCEAETLETASLHVDYSVARRMPDTLFGLFFEVRLATSLFFLFHFFSCGCLLFFSLSKSALLLFVQEINHAGSGGLWAELVSNRGNTTL
jgi:alpha-N-arabinofuranosidase